MPAPYLHAAPDWRRSRSPRRSRRPATRRRSSASGTWAARASCPDRQGFDVNIGGSETGTPRSYFSPYKMPSLPDGPPGEYLTDRLTDEAVRFIEAHRGPPLLPVPVRTTRSTPRCRRSRTSSRSTRPRRRTAAPERPRVPPRRRAHGPAGPGPSGVRGDGREPRPERRPGHGDARTSSELDDRTIVIFTSDNGGLSTSEGSPTSNVPLRAGKGWLYEGGVRVPLIVRWPGVTKPGAVCRRADDQHRLLPDDPRDDRAGAPPRAAPRRRQPRAAAQGRRRARSVRCSGTTRTTATRAGAPCGAVRSGDLKLIEWFEDDRVELFDLRDDPGETRNLAADRPETRDRTPPEAPRLASLRERPDADAESGFPAGRRSTGIVLRLTPHGSLIRGIGPRPPSMASSLVIDVEVCQVVGDRIEPGPQVLRILTREGQRVLLTAPEVDDELILLGMGQVLDRSGPGRG